MVVMDFFPFTSCGKVMFLHLSVILFTEEWGLCPGRVSVGGWSLSRG